MKIVHEFTVSAPLDRVWATLTDIEEVAPCLPGATLTGREGETYAGKIKVKVGPVTSEFVGTAGFTELDAGTHHAVLSAKGRDTRGSGNATALIDVQLRPDVERTVVTVDTDLTISGKLAQFGSGMIQQVSEKLLGQFVVCLEDKLTAGDGGDLDDVGSGAPGPAEPPLAPGAPETPGTAVVPEPPGEPSGLRRPPAREAEPLDLMQLAGGAVLTRLLPVLVVAVVIGVVLFLLLR